VKATVSVIVASAGRSTLARTLLSVAPQLLAGDELLVDVNDDAPWGHVARNRMMDRAHGEYLMFMDDDDVYTDDALLIVRRELLRQPDSVHLFRLRYGSGEVIWREPILEEGQVSTQTVVVPNRSAKLGRWGERYQGDFDFIAQTCQRMGEPVWHDAVIALCRP
jgi:glycosyltransferase involved in cell wall biosynthesis